MFRFIRSSLISRNNFVMNENLVHLWPVKVKTTLHSSSSVSTDSCSRLVQQEMGGNKNDMINFCLKCLQLPENMRFALWHEEEGSQSNAGFEWRSLKSTKRVIICKTAGKSGGVSVIMEGFSGHWELWLTCRSGGGRHPCCAYTAAACSCSCAFLSDAQIP